MVLVGHPPEHTLVHQAVEPLGEDVPRDPEASLEGVEAGYAEEGITDDEQAPPFPDHLQALGH
jgi:hypothetical protein